MAALCVDHMMRPSVLYHLLLLPSDDVGLPGIYRTSVFSTSLHWSVCRSVCVWACVVHALFKRSSLLSLKPREKLGVSIKSGL